MEPGGRGVGEGWNQEEGCREGDQGKGCRGGMEPGGRGVGRGTRGKGCRGGMEPGGRGVGEGWNQEEGV